ncbi:MAG: multicopper oxidase domain-containing protein [Candidatus Brocadiales bacterium]
MKKAVSFLLGFVIIVVSLTCTGIGVAFSQDISRAANDFTPYGLPLGRNKPATVDVTFHAHERIGTLDAGPDGVVGTGDDVTYKFFTFGHSDDPTTGKVPGPFVRVLEGDTVNFTLVNPATNTETHSIDLHAVKGSMGGAAVLSAAPGNSASFTFKVSRPGCYMYHCVGEGASNIPSIAHHIANGMVGMILVEPRKGGKWFKKDLRKADKEFYIVQMEYYLAGFDPANPPAANPHDWDVGNVLAEHPDYVVFNGRAGVERTTLEFNPSGNIVTPVVMSVNINDDVIIYFGNSGPNLISSCHMIGEIWDREYHLADLLSKPKRNIQTTPVPAMGASVFAFRTLVEGLYVFVDHSIGRVAKGALGAMVVE